MAAAIVRLLPGWLQPSRHPPAQEPTTEQRAVTAAYEAQLAKLRIAVQQRSRSLGEVRDHIDDADAMMRDALGSKP